VPYIFESNYFYYFTLFAFNKIPGQQLINHITAIKIKKIIIIAISGDKNMINEESENILKISTLE
jgi:hypothetical protein